MKFIVFVIHLAVFSVHISSSARILGIVSTPSYSHQIVFQPLWRELLDRGHKLTVLTTNPMNDTSLTNLTEIDLSFSYKVWNENIVNMIESQNNVIALVSFALSIIGTIADEQLQHPPVQNLIKNESEHFDLLVVECQLPTMFAFSHRFKCPFIGMSSHDISTRYYNALGNPTHPILYPEMNLPFAGELTFLERLSSVLFIFFQNIIVSWCMLPAEQLRIQKYFGKDYPLIGDTVRNMSMIFVNTNPILYPIRPLVPAIIQIGGGTHRQATKPLPQELQLILDEATRGFIYFSLGSNIKSKDLPNSVLNTIIQTFAELPFTILWKFELEYMPKKPHNVIISKWFPQQAIFKHPNIKLFITQGGLQSIEEAIFDHIPMVGIPVFFDQPSNVKKLVWKGLGLSVNYETIKTESFKAIILEVINNPKYRKKTKELAKLAKDEQMTGLERAVWWTEYVVRHKGAKHFKSPAMELPFYQYYLLDVIGFCLIVICLIMSIIMKFITIICSIIRYCKSKKLKIKEE